MSRIDEIRKRWTYAYQVALPPYEQVRADIDYLLSLVDGGADRDPADMTGDELNAAMDFHRRQIGRYSNEAAKIWRLRIRLNGGEEIDKQMLAELHARRATAPTETSVRCGESLLRSLCAEHSHVRFVEGVLGGVQPLIEGHRVGVSHLLGRMAIGMSVAEYKETWDFDDDTIKDVFAYAQDVIDALIDRERECVFPATEQAGERSKWKSNQGETPTQFIDRLAERGTIEYTVELEERIERLEALIAQSDSLLYRLARHVRNTDEIPPTKWAVQGLDLLAELRAINPARYDQSVKTLSDPAPAAPVAQAADATADFEPFDKCAGRDCSQCDGINCTCPHHAPHKHNCPNCFHFFDCSETECATDYSASCPECDKKLDGVAQPEADPVDYAPDYERDPQTGEVFTVMKPMSAFTSVLAMRAAEEIVGLERPDVNRVAAIVSRYTAQQPEVDDGIPMTPQQMRQQLAEAAREIPCAGPIAHRIRVLKREHEEEVERLQGEVERLRAALTELMNWGVEFDDARLHYITVQVDRDAIKDALEQLKGEGK